MNTFYKNGYIITYEIERDDDDDKYYSVTIYEVRDEYDEDAWPNMTGEYKRVMAGWCRSHYEDLRAEPIIDRMETDRMFREAQYDSKYN